MPDAQIGLNLSAAGISIGSNTTITRTADGSIGVAPTLPVAWPLSSWVKTDADTAAGNLAGGHGQTDGTYDVFWTGGQRYGVAVTISTNAVSLDGGAGTDFPASGNTTVTIVKQTAVNVSIDGDSLAALGIELVPVGSNDAIAGSVTFKDADGDTIAHVTLVGGVAQVWDITGGANNPFTGDPITVAYASQASSTYTATLKIAGVVDSTP